MWITWKKTVPALADDTDAVLTAEYNDHGNWARHYSTVRMTLGTFFFTGATAILYSRWDKPELIVGWSALVFFVIGVSLFLRFTALTYDKMRHQTEVTIAYRDFFAAGRKKADDPKALDWRSSPDGLPVAAAFLILFTAFDLWWMYGHAPTKPPVDSKVTVSVQVNGQTRTIEVPVKLDAP